MSSIPPQAMLDPDTRPVPGEVLERLGAFKAKWIGRKGKEEQLSQSFLTELCHALGVPTPGDDPSYEFEHRVTVPGRTEAGKIDLYYAKHFVLESKCGRDSKKDPWSSPVRGTKAYWGYIERAYREQALVYASLLTEGPPPLLIVLDVGEKFWIWRGFDGRFDGFHSPHKLEIPFAEIDTETNARVLLACWEDPSRLDPSKHQERITREAVSALAKLAAELEAVVEGEDAPERIARFLMRCLFCMFAEDVELLESEQFTTLLRKAETMPEHFAAAAGQFFRTMNEGGIYDFARVRHFNGELFKDAEALPLNADQIALMREAAEKDWSKVDPAIFGTLLERALDKKERKKLGAHFTPRRYVERVVRATIEDPLRTEWELLQAQTAELIGDQEKPDKKSVGEVWKLHQAFLKRLRQVKVLDPACGTANFLYVSYAILKELEHEVLEALRLLELGGQEGLEILGEAVVPEQMLGIEVKPWSAEIAQLVLWIGHLQWELQHRDKELNEPILPTKRTIECRDALITWERVEQRLDDDSNPLTAWDGLTMKEHPTTGKLVPDDSAQVPVVDYVGVDRAVWPTTTFVVGNPPFIGNKAMRTRLGDGYVDAVRNTYKKDIPNSVDFVSYWWGRAANLVAQGELQRFGLITTNTIRQTQNRKLVQRFLSDKGGLALAMAVPDHPWVDDGAAVRVSMTCVDRAERTPAARFVVIQHEGNRWDDIQVSEHMTPSIHADLTSGANVSSAVALLSNERVSFQGMNLVGKGFRLSQEQVSELGYDLTNLPPQIRPHLNAREMMQKREHRYVIDAFGLTSDELRTQHPRLYQWLLDHVKPEREAKRGRNRDADDYADRWWQFAKVRNGLRSALRGLPHFIATPETAKHRAFERFDWTVCPDHALYAIALEEDWHYGVLQSRPHRVWSLAAGGTLEDRPRYNNTRCFKTFAFPDVSSQDTKIIGAAAMAVETHLQRVRSNEATLTSIFNLVDARRENRPLSDKEKKLHAIVATDVLVELLDELDHAVLDAYGWPHDISDEELITRLLALNHERAEEEANGKIRWLRPDLATEQQTATKTKKAAKKATKAKWPSDPLDQMAAIMAASQAQPGPFSADDLASRFQRAQRRSVEKHLEALARQLLVIKTADGVYQRVGR